MNHSFMALALQEPASDSSTWIIIGVVLVILFLIVVIVIVGLTIFFVMRRRNKAQKVPAASAMGSSMGPSATAYAGMSHPPEITPVPEPLPEALEVSAAAMDNPPPAPETDPFSSPQASSEEPLSSGSSMFDPTRTVAIIREEEAVDYGRIRFISGVLAGEEFAVEPEGAYIGRESTLSQIVVSDPRISKRHLWIGVRDGSVKIEDQDSRNGTFVNDPKSERVKEATLNSGDTVILGESDVARFEYQL